MHLIGQAKVAFESGDWTKFESLLLRAQRPELAVKQYRDAGMWPEALRVRLAVDVISLKVL